MEETTIVLRWIVGLLAGALIVLVAAVVGWTRQRNRRRHSERDRRLGGGVTEPSAVSGPLMRFMGQLESRVARSLANIGSHRRD